MNKTNEHYMLTCLECGFTHHIPADSSLPRVAFSVDVKDVKMTCLFGGVFTVSLEVKDFFSITPVPDSNEVLHLSIQDNIIPLHHHMLSHCDPLFLIVKQTTNRTTHQYKKTPKGSTYVKYSRDHGFDIIGNIDVSKAEIPGATY